MTVLPSPLGQFISICLKKKKNIFSCSSFKATMNITRGEKPHRPKFYYKRTKGYVHLKIIVVLSTVLYCQFEDFLKDYRQQNQWDYAKQSHNSQK